MIRRCKDIDFDAIVAIINDAAQAYRSAIAADCWKDPYMPEQELRLELADGVVFWGFEENGELGNPLLSETRLPAGLRGREKPPSEKVLVDPAATGREFGGAC
jgi:hypothetical protein